MTLDLLDRTLRLLRAHEYCELDNNDDLQCFSCKVRDNDKHRMGCEYALVIAALEAEREKSKATLTEGSDGEWECSACHEAFFFIDSGPKENLYAFCSYCGARITEYVEYKDPLDDDEEEEES
jgi:hypothetical protein